MEQNDELKRLQHLVRQLLEDIPYHRDWLNPDIENELRSMSAKPPEVYPTYKLYEVTRVWHATQRFFAASEDDARVIASESDRNFWSRNTKHMGDTVTVAPKFNRPTP